MNKIDLTKPIRSVLNPGVKFEVVGEHEDGTIFVTWISASNNRTVGAMSRSQFESCYENIPQTKKFYVYPWAGAAPGALWDLSVHSTRELAEESRTSLFYKIHKYEVGEITEIEVPLP